jgi:CBS domain-containing protein
MNSALLPRESTADQLFLLSGLLRRRPVFLGGEKIGWVDDFIILDKDTVAEVTHVCVGRSFGRPRLFVPWQNVQAVSAKAVVLGPAAEALSVQSAPQGAVLLQDYIVDKKVLDVEGREVEVVYDVALALRQNRLFVVGVDVSRRALLRRIGLKWLANFTASITDGIANEIIAWDLVEPLPEKIGSFAGDIRLKVVKGELAKMPPVDVARILEQLTREQRLAVFNGMENGSASDALEELDPKSQREVIAAMPPARAARLIDHMTPGQAADVLAVLPWAQANAVLRLLGEEKGEKVRDILETQDERIASYVSVDCVKLRPDNTALEARQSYQQAQARDAVAYLYVVDAADKLLGVVGTTDLIMALDGTRLGQIMKKVVTLTADSTLKDASEAFARYGFRALPVTDQQGKFLGIVPYRDVMNLKHRYLE